MRTVGFSVAAIALICSSAFGQLLDDFTLTDGTATYTERNLRTGGPGAGSADFVVAGTEQLFQNWWWFRASGMSREVALSNQTFGILEAANRAGMEYSEPTGAGNVDFEISYELNDLVTRQRVDIDFRITNRTANTIQLDFFAYTDFDLDGSFGGDTAFIGRNGSAQFIADGLVNAELNASTDGLHAWEIDSFPLIRDKLENAMIDDLSNSGSPFGPGDYTGAFQWRVTLVPGEEFHGTYAKIYEVPEPASLLALLAIAPALLRRR